MDSPDRIEDRMRAADPLRRVIRDGMGNRPAGPEPWLAWNVRHALRTASRDGTTDQAALMFALHTAAAYTAGDDRLGVDIPMPREAIGQVCDAAVDAVYRQGWHQLSDQDWADLAATAIEAATDQVREVLGRML